MTVQTQGFMFGLQVPFMSCCYAKSRKVFPPCVVLKLYRKAAFWFDWIGSCDSRNNWIISRSHRFSVTQLTSPWTSRLSDISNYDSLCDNFLPQLKNSLKSDLCLDQGPDTDNIPILYLCHGMTPQVRTPSSLLQPISLLYHFCLCVKSPTCL